VPLDDKRIVIQTKEGSVAAERLPPKRIRDLTHKLAVRQRPVSKRPLEG
jgi:hypothetical protein